MYHEMRSVVYKTFNFERMHTVLGKLLLNGNEGSEVDVAENYKFTGHNIPTPEQIAATEKIFLPPDHLATRHLSRTAACDCARPLDFPRTNFKF